MPANLPPQYFEVEKRFRSAKNPLEKIDALEEMLAIMPKHKGTDHLKAELRSRIAKLTQQAGKKAGGHRASMLIQKEGAAQVAVIGLPNVGKSLIVSCLTKASPTVADYPFTTHIATPGMMIFENIQIQLIDTPPFVPQTTEYWLPHMLRRADALICVIDLYNDPLPQVKSILNQLETKRIEITGNKRLLIVGNKLDLDNGNNLYHLQNAYQQRYPVIGVSAITSTGLNRLKQTIYELLNIIRVYTKIPGGKPDFTDPITIPRGSTLEDAAEAVHKDFKIKLKYARIWGSGKHEGVMIRKKHILQDGDIIELHV